METALAIAFLLFIAALVVFVIDLLIPTGGILIAVTGLLGFGAVVFAFRHSPVSGYWMLIATLACIPIMIFVLLYVWPHTPIGKRMIAKPDSPGEFVWSDAATVGDPTLLIGVTGQTETEFLPHGLVRIAEKSYEAVSDSGPINPGVWVKVTRVDVGRLVVIPIRTRSTDDEPMSSGSGLDRPISELNLDSIE
jgi:membrane-bound ClpP family serine protease